MSDTIQELWVKIKADVASLKKDFDSVRNEAKRNAKSIESEYEKAKLHFNTSIAKKSLNEIKTIHSRLKKQLEDKIKIGADVGTLTALKDRIETLQGVMDRFDEGGVSKKKKNIFDNLAASALKFSGIIGGMALVKNAFSGFTELETKMKNVNTIIQVSGDQLKSYSNQILDLSGKLGKPASELADAMYQAVSAGMSAGEAIIFIETASKSATAGLSNTTTAVDGITSVLNAYQLSASEAGKISDLMFTTVNLGKTNFDQLSNSLSNVTPLASALGVEFSEVAGAIATMTKQGVETSKATTQIRAALTSMNQILGDGWSKSMTLQEAFSKVREKAGGSDTKLQEMIGTMEGVSAVLALTGKNAKMASDDLNAMANSAGATEKAFKEQADSIDFKINRLKTSFKNLSLALIDNFAPAVSWVVENFTEGLDRIMGKIDDTQKAIDKTKSSRQTNWNESLKGTDESFRKAELERIQSEIEKYQKQYDDFANKKTFLGINTNKEEMDNLRILLDDLRTYRSVLKSFKEESKSSAPTPIPLIDAKQLSDASKQLMESLKFTSEKYYEFRKQQIAKDAETFRKAGLDAVQIKQYEVEQLNKLDQEAFEFRMKLLKDEAIQKKADKINVDDLGGFNYEADKRNRFINLTKEDLKKIEQIRKEHEENVNEIINEAEIERDIQRQTWFQASVAGFNAIEDGLTNLMGSFELFKTDTSDKLTNAFRTMANSFAQAVEQMIAKWLAFKAITTALDLIDPSGGLSNMFSFATGNKKASRGGEFANNGLGVIKASRGIDFTVPKNFPYDSYNMKVETGERVKVMSAHETKFTSELGSNSQIAQLLTAVKALNLNLIEKDFSVNIINNAPDVESRVIRDSNIRYNLLTKGVNLDA